jgi:DeoR family transcriptional regulator, aga operon transcriptional repressor
MLTEERRSKIVEVLNDKGRVEVKELSKRFRTSEVTIRHDLQQLHNRGLVLRSHGGALRPESAMAESPLKERLRSHPDEKRRIGECAAGLVREGETVILDSGSTTHSIARYLRGKQGLKVITNGVNISMELLGARGIQLIQLGGVLREDSVSVVGHFAEEMLAQFSADKVFIGAYACHPEFGLSAPNPDEARVNQAMMKIAREKILVADSSKFAKSSLIRVAPLSGINTVVTDRGLPDSFAEKLREMGIQLLLV